MGRCRTTDEAEPKRSESSLAKALAPEEIRRGDFVTPLYVVSEWPSFYWATCESLGARDELVRIISTPADEPEPLEVRSVCLPFVLVKTPSGKQRTLDVRRCRLARLNAKFAAAARRGLRKSGKRKKKLAPSH